MTKKRAAALFKALHDANPRPRGELRYETPFELLVAVVLSAQATDVGVNRATPALFAAANTPETMVALGEERIREFIRSIGLFNNKAKNIHALSRLLVENHQGRVPKDRAALMALPGVGRKSANIILNVAFGHPTLAVDTHVFRVANRTGLAVAKTPEAVERGLLKIIPDEYLYNAHHWLILHGRYVCKARKPDCGTCLIRTWCREGEKWRDSA